MYKNYEFIAKEECKLDVYCSWVNLLCWTWLHEQSSMRDAFSFRNLFIEGIGFCSTICYLWHVKYSIVALSFSKTYCYSSHRFILQNLYWQRNTIKRKKSSIIAIGLFHIVPLKKSDFPLPVVMLNRYFCFLVKRFALMTKSLCRYHIVLFKNFKNYHTLVFEYCRS